MGCYQSKDQTNNTEIQAKKIEDLESKNVKKQPNKKQAATKPSPGILPTEWIVPLSKPHKSQAMTPELNDSDAESVKIAS
mmetsp:Transcript_19322/g.28596  ORF Transcript_19322/g.28596 Transcript_19322/m.28596 type:complete len:80 (+) Transcript_19322:27-266(+)